MNGAAGTTWRLAKRAERLHCRPITTGRQHTSLHVRRHLGSDQREEVGKRVKSWLFEYMSSGPVVAAVVEGIHAIDMVRKLAGASFNVRRLADVTLPAKP